MNYFHYIVLYDIISLFISLNSINSRAVIKQLLDEVEHDNFIMNYQNRGLCYLPKPKAEVDNTDTNNDLIARLDEVSDEEDLDLIPPRPVDDKCQCCGAVTWESCVIS